jgi:hypothetical protein
MTITREMITDMFTSIRGRAKWSIDGECLWSYFFTDTNREKLLAAGRALEASGFKVVGFLEPAEQTNGMVYLRLDRIETHTVESLFALNEWLYEFAEAQNLASYDGMEAGSAASGIGN